MATEYILGPSLSSVVEPEDVPVPTPGRVGINWHTTPTEPGGKVNVVLGTPVAATDARPTFVHAIYVNPPELVPTGADKTAAWFMGSVHPKSSVAVPQAPADASGVLSIAVPGVKPGIHHVQTVLEYNVP